MLAESCGQPRVSEKCEVKKAADFTAKIENENCGNAHQSYTGAALDRKALSWCIFTYTAREQEETGLYYYRARYYQPGIGRFISEDPIGRIRFPAALRKSLVNHF